MTWDEQWEALERTRRDLFERLVKARQPSEWLALQVYVARAIRRGEVLKARSAKSERPEVQWHIDLCRSYADAIAWRVLHPHVIRHYSNLPGKPPHLGGIRQQLKRYLRFAEPFVDLGLPVLLPDVTNILRLGDVIVVGDPNAPEVIEFKGEHVILPHRLEVFLKTRAGLPMEPRPTESVIPVRGRAARQLGALVARQAYFLNERGFFPQESMERLVLTLKSPLEHVFHHVGAAIAEAIDTGIGYVLCGPSQALLAVRGDADLPGQLPSPASLTPGFRIPMAALNLRPSNPLWHVAPPPTEWGLSEEATWMLMDGEMFLVHFVDLAAFEDENDARLRFRVRVQPGQDPFVDIEVRSWSLGLGEKFLWDLLYGFHTVSSIVGAAREFVLEVADLADAHVRGESI